MKIYLGVLNIKKGNAKEELSGDFCFFYKLGYGKLNDKTVAKFSIDNLFKTNEYKKGLYYFVFNVDEGLFSCIRDNNKKILCNEAYLILLMNSYINDSSIVDEKVISSINDIIGLDKANKKPEKFFKAFRLNEDFSFIRNEIKDEETRKQIDKLLEIGKKVKIDKSADTDKQQFDYKNNFFDKFRITIDSLEFINAFLEENPEYDLTKKELVDESYTDEIIPQFNEKDGLKITFSKDNKTYNSIVKVFVNGFYLATVKEGDFFGKYIDYIEDAMIHLYSGKYKKLTEDYDLDGESYYLERDTFEYPWGYVILKLPKTSKISKFIKEHDERLNHAYYDMDDKEDLEIEKEIVDKIKNIVKKSFGSKIEYNERRIKECLKFEINGRDYRIHWGKRKWIILDCINFKNQYKFPLKVIFVNHSVYRLELKDVNDVLKLEPYIEMLYGQQ